MATISIDLNARAWLDVLGHVAYHQHGSPSIPQAKSLGVTPAIQLELV